VNRRTLKWTIIIGVPLAALAVWIGSNTYWTDVTVPMPMRGEAATNPHYAAQRFVEALGGRTTREQGFSLPAPGGVVVLSAWNWNLIPRRRDALEAWVERGGRLVMDDSVQGGPEFARWSGIEYVERQREDDNDDARDEPESPCFDFAERIAGKEPRPQQRHLICDVDVDWTLETNQAVDWQIDEGRVGRQALRVRVGRGSVTVINGQLLTYRKLFDGDHGWLLVAATQLRPGDEVRFLSEGEYPSLLALTWQTGAPVVVLGLTVLGLALWRNGVRLGPLTAEEPPVRRSLAEQIRGTGRFALLHDGGEPLHAATVRALDDVARRRVSGWAALDPRGRVRALASLGGVAPDALDAALHDSRARSANDLHDTLALLETVRRALIRQKRTGHGIS
jgi:hypothetical protein